MWDEQIGVAVSSLAKTLSEYEPATLEHEPEEVKDLLKRLYQYLVPKKIRHDLGEYYTPDWLAELVISEVGYDGNVVVGYTLRSPDGTRLSRFPVGSYTEYFKNPGFIRVGYAQRFGFRST